MTTIFHADEEKVILILKEFGVFTCLATTKDAVSYLCMTVDAQCLSIMHLASTVMH